MEACTAWFLNMTSNVKFTVATGDCMKQNLCMVLVKTTTGSSMYRERSSLFRCHISVVNVRSAISGMSIPCT